MLAAAVLVACIAGAQAVANNLCVLYASLNFTGFNLARVEFATKTLTDLASLPTLGGAGDGISAGADDGTFYLPNANIAYNYLLEVTTHNTTSDRYVAAPAGYSGVPAFYVMDLNVATGEVYSVFEESSAIRWVVAAEVFVENGTSVALSGDFVAQWLAFDWRKEGVSAVDSQRGLLYICVGVKSGGGYDTSFLAGIPMSAAARSSSPVVNFTMIAGPEGEDIIDAGYSVAHDVLVVSTFNISTGVAALYSRPADPAAPGAVWRTLQAWPRGTYATMELGNGDISDDGETFFVSWVAAESELPLFMAVDVASGKVTQQWTVPNSLRAEMIVADVAVCS